jgi:hypothetical protein
MSKRVRLRKLQELLEGRLLVWEEYNAQSDEISLEL